MKKKTREKLIEAYNRVFMESPVRFEPYLLASYGPMALGWICDKEDLEALIPLFKFSCLNEYEYGDINLKAEEQLMPAIIAIDKYTFFISPAITISDAEKWRYKIRILIELARLTISEKNWQELTKDGMTDIPECEEG